MGGHHDGDHGEEVIHQAPWVMWITIAICLVTTFAMLLLKIMIA